MIKIDICCFNITNIAIPQFMSQFSRNELGLFNIITRPFKNSQIDNSNNNDKNNNDTINTTTSTTTNSNNNKNNNYYYYYLFKVGLHKSYIAN